jgi:hypothetical protein
MKFLRFSWSDALTFGLCLRTDAGRRPRASGPRQVGP